jgi:hypothetical protein
VALALAPALGEMRGLLRLPVALALGLLEGEGQGKALNEGMAPARKAVVAALGKREGGGERLREGVVGGEALALGQGRVRALALGEREGEGQG